MIGETKAWASGRSSYYLYLPKNHYATPACGAAGKSCQRVEDMEPMNPSLWKVLNAVPPKLLNLPPLPMLFQPG
jgi:hypothetical protein